MNGIVFTMGLPGVGKTTLLKKVERYLKPTHPYHHNLCPTASRFFEAFSYLINKTTQVVMGESILAAICGVVSEGCPCGITSMRIHSKTIEGRIPVSPCVYLHDYKVGNLLTDDIFEIVNSPSFKAFRHRRKEIPKKCHELNCKYLESCRGGCAARAYLVNGDLNELDPYCPTIYEMSGFPLPEFPSSVVVGHEGTRVHENYLCTWIGKPI
ncbi:TPA: SPASM domain-containing protein [Candidatus Poribacteria bacterium]|nr:SPASM domain-containing protein [Candidatus Poribacteria bacterium]